MYYGQINESHTSPTNVATIYRREFHRADKVLLKMQRQLSRV